MCLVSNAFLADDAGAWTSFRMEFPPGAGKKWGLGDVLTLEAEREKGDQNSHLVIFTCLLERPSVAAKVLHAKSPLAFVCTTRMMQIRRSFVKKSYVIWLVCTRHS